MGAELRPRLRVSIGALLWLNTILASVVVGPLIAGCAQTEPWGTLVVNKTASTVEVLSVGDAGAERDLGSISPGMTLPLHPYFGVTDGSCSHGTLVIRRGSATGPEIARRTEPLCYRDSWVIAEPGGSSAP